VVEFRAPAQRSDSSAGPCGDKLSPLKLGLVLITDMIELAEHTQISYGIQLDSS
jgi:hypothetical protein